MSEKLTDRDALATQPADGDLFHVVDVSDTTDSADGTSKKIAYSNLIPDASTSVKGKVELATDAETTTGTDTARAITPANLTAQIGTRIQAYDADLTTWAGITPGANVATFLATPSSSNLAAAVTGETGSGALVFGTAPTIDAPVIKNWDGWNSVTDSWSYASASSVTVPSGAASLYQKGDRVKFTQTTVKYFVIVAVADTTLTFAVNNDYTVANAAISAIAYSHQINPIGYPTFFGYDPTWTGFSAAPTQDVLYTIEGNKCTLYFNGHSGTSSSVTFEITAPVAPNLPGSATQDNLVTVLNNGSWQNQPGVLAALHGSTTLKVGLSPSTIAGATYAGFTGSNGKGLTGIISYRF